MTTTPVKSGGHERRKSSRENQRMDGQSPKWPRRTLYYANVVTIVVVLLLQARNTIVQLNGCQRPAMRTVPLPLENTTTTLATQDPMHVSQNDQNGSFDSREWKIPQCFAVENVCHSTHQWFYDPNSTSPRPSWKLDFIHTLTRSLSFSTLNPGYPVEISVNNDTTTTAPGNCLYSSIPNHMVLFSVFNQMLGEFYVRLWMGINDMVNENVRDNDWYQDVQFYLHSYKGKHPLDSHLIFLDPFLSNPLLSIYALLDNSKCRCLRRLYLCGYNQRQEGNETILWATRDNFGKNYLSKEYWHKYQQARDLLRDMVVGENPLLQLKIRQYRQDLLKHVANPENYKIVGLAQRTGRRRWSNMAQVLRTCRKDELFKRSKVIFVKVNVEDDWSNPINQVVMHASLDMLVGIHGAQLTDALWMPDGAVVLELLPYIPDKLGFGQWTRTIDQPTPLGVIFAQTDINHIGYRLPPASVPNCGPNANITCYQKPFWDERDFVVDTAIIKRAIQTFLTDRNETGVDCGDIQRAAGADFVLYNVQCKEGADANMTHHQFYKTAQS